MLKYIIPSWGNPTTCSKKWISLARKGSQKQRKIRTGNIYSADLYPRLVAIIWGRGVGFPLPPNNNGEYY